MIFRIVFFQIRDGNENNKMEFRYLFDPIKKINYEHSCIDIEILESIGNERFAYISKWLDMNSLNNLRNSSEYRKFVDLLLNYVIIESDFVFHNA